MAVTNERASSVPDQLIRYADVAGEINNQLENEARLLGAALETFAATCTEYSTGIGPALAAELRAYVRDIAPTDEWVRQVGIDFHNADQGPAGAIAGGAAGAAVAAVLRKAVAVLEKQMGVNQLPPPPAPPPPPPSGDGSGEHGAVERNWLERRYDDAQKMSWYSVATAADAAGLDDAARHMRHYLDNSGEDLTVAPEDILNDLPDFRQRSEAAFREDVLNEVNRRIANEYTGQPMRFQLTSQWRSYNVGQPPKAEQVSNEGNWFYALGGFSYSHGADVIVTPGVDGKPQVRIAYQMHIFDRYNWDAGKGVDIVGIPTPDESLGHLHHVGIAQEYEIRGSSAPSIITYTYPGTNYQDKSSIPVSGSETRDEVISRDQVISRDDPRVDLPDRGARSSSRDTDRSS